MATKRSAGFQVKPLLFALLTVSILILAYVTYDRSLPPGNIAGKPNIIVIMTDDQRYDSLDVMPRTVGRLGGQGVTFTNAFVTTPLCCPSRTSFLSGKYAHNTGVWNDVPPEGGVESFQDTSTLPVWLRDAGYTTALIGTYLEGYENSTYVPPGWTEWHAITRGNYYGYSMNDNGVLTEYGYDKDDYSGTVIKEKAVAFLQEMRRSGDAFFLVLTPNIPHAERGKDDTEQETGLTPARPAPHHADSCLERAPYRPPNFNEVEISDKPQSISSQKLLSEEEIEKIDAFHVSQKCALQAVDEMVEDIIVTLGQLRENTLIIYSSDNGFAYGEHRRTGKNCLYEECVRVPLIISYPKLTKNATISQSFATNIDLTATIADIAELALSGQINGRSLFPILHNTGSEVRSEILLEVNNTTTERKDYAIRTKQYKYIERGTGEKELYDLVQDPYELINLAPDRNYDTVRSDLAQKLADLREE